MGDSIAGAAKAPTIFLVSPLGVLGSEERQAADHLEDIIENMVKSLKLEGEIDHQPMVKRGDKGEGACITTEVENELRNADLVVAYLGHGAEHWNANVMYEFGYRRAIGEPMLVLAHAQDEDKLPFDIRNQRLVLLQELAISEIKGEPYKTLKERLGSAIRELDGSERANRSTQPVVAIDEKGKGEIFQRLLPYISTISDGNTIRVLCQHSAEDGQQVDKERQVYLSTLLDKASLPGVRYHRLVSDDKRSGSWIQEHVDTGMKQLKEHKAKGEILCKYLKGRFLSCDVLFVRDKFAIMFVEILDQNSDRGQVEGALVLHGSGCSEALEMFDRLFYHLWDQ